MYKIIKAVVESGRYELSDMLNKIDTVWVQGDISAEQRAEVVEMAREHANPENSYASLREQVDILRKEIAGLRSRIVALEGGGEILTPEEYPEYVQPTGAHDAYNSGDKITYNGVHYICQMDGCVWAPDTYPAGWVETLT